MLFYTLLLSLLLHNTYTEKIKEEEEEEVGFKQSQIFGTTAYPGFISLYHVHTHYYTVFSAAQYCKP